MSSPFAASSAKTRRRTSTDGVCAHVNVLRQTAQREAWSALPPGVECKALCVHVYAGGGRNNGRGRLYGPAAEVVLRADDVTTGNTRSLPVTLLSGLGRKRLTSEAVERNQVLCFPEPLMSAKGFSCRRAARPCLAVLQGELELAGHDLLVPGVEGDAHLEVLVLDLLHALEGQDVGAGQGAM